MAARVHQAALQQQAHQVLWLQRVAAGIRQPFAPHRSAAPSQALTAAPAARSISLCHVAGFNQGPVEAGSSRTQLLCTRAVPTAAAAAAAPDHGEQDDNDDDTVLLGLDDDGGAPEALDGSQLVAELGLPLPAERHQRALDYKSIKALRTAANTAAKNKTLLNIQVTVRGMRPGRRIPAGTRVFLCGGRPHESARRRAENAQVGQQGITQTFLSACMDILGKHEYVRVRLGEGCGLERKAAAQALEQLLDCVSVHQIGYTITLYRQEGLPRPSNCPANDAPAQVPVGSEAQGEGAQGPRGAGRGASSPRQAASGKKQGPAAGGAQAAGARGGKQQAKAGAGRRRQQRESGGAGGVPGGRPAAVAPPEFEVLGKS